MFLVLPHPTTSVVFLSLDQLVLQKDKHAVEQVMLQVKIVIVLKLQLVQLTIPSLNFYKLSLFFTLAISKHGKLLQKTELD